MNRFPGRTGPARPPFAVAPLLLVLVALGCSGIEPRSDRVVADRQAELQLLSLEDVHFAGGSLPPLPSDDELAALDDRLAAAPRAERTELRSYYGSPELLVYATRDSDGDGIQDYRVSNYWGKFLEGDIDVDQDGIRNVLDVAPYDASLGGVDDDGDGAPDRAFADEDGDGIPDHVDWSGEGRTAESTERQRELFARHGILLLDRGARLDDRLTRTIHDALTSVFRAPLREAGVIAVLRTVATDETCLLASEVDDGTNAMAIPQTQSLLIYRSGIDAAPIVQLGLVVHELAHAWQFSLDFDREQPELENRRVHTPAPDFLTLVEPFGWSGKAVGYDPAVDDYRLFTPHYYGIEPLYFYRGEAPEDWADRLTVIYEEVGDDYLEDPRLADEGIVGDYSLSSPWEWHADSLMAYLYGEIATRARSTLAASEAEPALEAMDRSLRQQWPGFRYQNLAAEVRDHLASTFPLRPEDLDRMIDGYLLPSASPTID